MYHSYMCQGSNEDTIDCSTLHSMQHRYVYIMCILHSPPRLMGSTITVWKRLFKSKVDFCLWYWLIWSQTNSFVVCTLWCLTLKSAVLIYIPVLHNSVLSQHIDKGSKLIGSLVVEDPLISWFDCVDTWIVKIHFWFTLSTGHYLQRS